MNKSKRNKKRVTKRRSKKNYVAKLIKLDKKGNTLVVFNKAVPKRVVKKVLSNMDSGDYVDLCRMQNARTRHTFKRVRGRHRYDRVRNTRGKRKRSGRKYLGKGGSDSAAATAVMRTGSAGAGFFSASTSALMKASGPVGGLIGAVSNGLGLLGGTTSVLVFGASVATLMYALKKSKIKLADSEESEESEINYMDEKIKQLSEDGGPCVRVSEKPSSNRGDYKNLSKSVLAKAPCPRNRRGSSPARIELWQQVYDDEDEKDKDAEADRQGLLAEANQTKILAVG